MFGKWRIILIFKMIQNQLMKCRNTNASRPRKKQSLELLYKSRFSYKLCNIYRKSPVLESLLNKVLQQVFMPARLLMQMFSYECCKILKIPILKICVRLLLTRHTNNICFLFIEECLLPKPSFLRLDFSLFSLRDFADVLNRAFLNFLFISMVY